MKIKQFISLSLLVALSVFLFSCNDKNTTIAVGGLSKDANVYKFAVKTGKQYTPKDSIAYPILDEAKFVVDQKRGLIYNPDSLPPETSLATFMPEITFASTGYPTVRLWYKADTISVNPWNTTDSIDFSLVKGFKIKPQDSAAPEREYIIEFRIHLVDPDSIIWKQMPSQDLKLDFQKTVFLNEVFYSFHTSNATVYLSSFDKTAWTSKQATDLPANTDIRSITVYDDQFFARNMVGETFSSNDGYSWNKQTNAQGLLTLSILGVLPGATEAEDMILSVVTKNLSLNKDAEYLFAKSTDMTSFTHPKVNGASTGKESVVESRFLYKNFSSVEKRLGDKMLLLTGGIESFDTTNDSIHMTNKTLSIKTKGDAIELTPTSMVTNIVITPQNDIPTFYYNDKLYAINDSTFAISSSLGGRWTTAPVKQDFDALMPQTMGQSVIVDKENYIWIFGGKPNNATQVWRGRLNKLNPR